MSILDLVGRRYVKTKQIILFLIAFGVSFSLLSATKIKIADAYNATEYVKVKSVDNKCNECTSENGGQ